MSNLARKLQQEQQQRVAEAPKKKKIKQSWLTPGEKLLILIFGLAICFGGTQVVTSHAAIYELNKDIQVLEASIQDQTKVNNDLEVQVSELSTYERIWAKAKELGLMLNENNVKVVQD